MATSQNSGPVKKQIRYTRPWLYPLQEEAIFYPRDWWGDAARFSWIEAGTKTGKTVGCIAWLFEQALVGKANENYWWTAPVRPQAEIAFNRMKDSYPRGTFDVNLSNLRLRLNDVGSIVHFKSAEIPDNLFGEDVLAAVYDEASRGREASYNALYSTLTATQGHARFIGNVKGRKNWFYSNAQKAKLGSHGHAYYRITATDAVDAGILADEIIAAAKHDLSDAVFRELYMAEPSDDGGNPFGLYFIKACVAPLSTLRPVAYGVDLAKSVDWTVIVGLDVNGACCRFERFQLPWNATMMRIKAAVGRTPTLIDSTGVGDPIVEMLQKSIGPTVEGYTFSMPSKQKLMEGLAVDIQKRQVAYPAGVIVDELEMFEYEYTRMGVRYAAMEGFHDDTVCALALAAQHRRTAQQPVVVSPNMMAWAKGGRR